MQSIFNSFSLVIIKIIIKFVRKISIKIINTIRKLGKIRVYLSLLTLFGYMIYKGSRLKSYLNGERGSYTDLANRMLRHRKPRKNASKEEYSPTPYLKDGHNITASMLTALMRETGQPIDFFIDFEPGELPSYRRDGVSGSNNIINSTVSNDLTAKVDHLNEILRLKDEMIADKERIIKLKDTEIEQWKKRYDDLIRLAQFGESDKNRT